MKNKWFLAVLLALFTWSSQLSASLIVDADGINISYAADAFGAPQLDPNLNLLVSDPGIEIAGNGSNDNSFAGLLFDGEFVDFFASSILFNFLADLNGMLTISGIDSIISSVTFSGAVQNVNLVNNTLEINILQGSLENGEVGTGLINLTFANDTSTPGTAVPEPGSLFLFVLALLGIGLVQRLNRLG